MLSLRKKSPSFDGHFTFKPHTMHSTNLAELIPLLEERIGVTPGFFERLDTDDDTDWASVIKLHALIEAAISHLLAMELRRNELEKVFSRLDISNKHTGKAAFVEALELLDKPARTFMHSLSTLRNSLVHDVKNVDFDLEKYVSEMSDQKKKQFVLDFNLLSTEVTNDIRKLFLVDPRQALWYSGMAFLGLVYLKIRPSISH